MAKKKTEAAAERFKPTPIPSDWKVTDEPSEAVMRFVALSCDDFNGVFLFRSGQELWLRVVELPA